MPDRKSFKRPLILLIAACAVFAFFFVMLFFLQVVKADENGAGENLRSYDVQVPASRGEILDRNGNTFVYNEQVNSLVVNATDFPYYYGDPERTNNERNEIIISLINYLEAKGETWIDELPIVFDESGAPVFEEDRETDIRILKSADMLGMNSYATARNCYDALIEEYNLEKYPASDAVKIASVRYNMKRTGFSESNPYTFAENVSVQTIAYVKENSDFYRGCDISVSSVRKYVGDGSLASHILGVVGSVDADEYAAAKERTAQKIKEAAGDENEIAAIKARAYSYNDKIGKSGLEQAMEEYLRGSSGIKTVYVDENENITGEEYKVRPDTGATVITTIDMNMQQIAEESLKNRILEVTDYAAIAGGMTPAGAVVVEDIKTGAILTSASYPDYSLATYYDDYSELALDPGKPLWNRAFQSGYSPGSTMKCATAIAALEEGIITPDSVFYCNGVYNFLDQTFVCFNKRAHGGVNVRTALMNSCNIFFFECARKLGIEKMNMYSTILGLGQKTGIEISETEGILAGIEYRDAQGLGWKAGETLLAAIGQSDNSFSPLQLVNYCSTIANGGTRYVPYLVSKILSSDYTRTLYARSPEVAVETNFKEENLEAVRKGMYLVANESYVYQYFSNLKYRVACKTGTAEKTRIVNGVRYEGTDGFLIAFGPYDDPQIAVSVVIENAGSGSQTAQVVSDIFDYYFSTLGTVQQVQDHNELL